MAELLIVNLIEQFGFWMGLLPERVGLVSDLVGSF